MTLDCNVCVGAVCLQQPLCCFPMFGSWNAECVALAEQNPLCGC